MTTGSGSDPIGGAKIGVIVVHGVGEAESGYAVNRLVGGLERKNAGYRIDPHSEVVRLSETPAMLHAIGTEKATDNHFRVVRRRATNPDVGSITFEELYWADLTSVQPGRINTLLGLFRVIFESHHLVAGMLDKRAGFAARVLRRLLLVSSWLMRGPLAALTIATSAIFALLLYGPVQGGSNGVILDAVAAVNVEDKFTLVQLVLCLFSIGVIAWIAVYRDISWYDTIFWLALVSGALVVLNVQGALPLVLERIPDLAFSNGTGIDCHKSENLGSCYIDKLYSVIVWGWRTWAVLMLAAMVLFLGVAAFTKSGNRPFALAPAATSISIVILQFMLWTMIVVTAVFPLLSRAEDIPDLMTIKRELAKTGSLDPLREMLSNNGTLKKLLDVPAVELDWIKRFKFVYGATALTLVVFVLLLFVIMGLRQLTAQSRRRSLEEKAALMPRLLFNGVLVGWLIVACFMVIASILLIAALERQYPELMSQAKEKLLPFAALVGVALPFLLTTRLSNAVHIARDLIDHQYTLHIETATYFFPSLFRNRRARPRRDQIQKRLNALLSGMIEREHFDRVVFVAHSQGSVVVADYFWEGAPDYKALGGARASMLSLGSPLGSVYERYFYAYPPGRLAPPALEARLQRWVNLYRVKDYVGGPLSGAPGLTIENHAMPVGGHMDYWDAPEAVEALDSLIRARAAGA